MADKNATLKDVDNNNLYPITQVGNVLGLSDAINNATAGVQSNVNTLQTQVNKLGTYTLLYSASVSTGTKTLSQSIANFRYLYFEYQSSDAGGGTIFIPVDIFKSNHTSSSTKLIISTDYLYCTVYYVNNTSIYIVNEGPGSNKTIKVYGVY